MSDMKTVSLSQLRRDGGLLESAAAGDEVMVTRFGRPYVRIISATQPRSFVGAGRRLGAKEPVSSRPVPASEWK
jgi:prevent-host-death family protein